jgi:hypothetical protein
MGNRYLQMKQSLSRAVLAAVLLTLSPVVCGYSFFSINDASKEKSTMAGGINTINITITDGAKQQEHTGQTAEQAIDAARTGITTQSAPAHSGALENKFDKDSVLKEISLQVAVSKEFSEITHQARALIDAKREKLKEDYGRGRLTQKEYEEKDASLKNWGLLFESVAAASPSLSNWIGWQFKQAGAEKQLKNEFKKHLGMADGAGGLELHRFCFYS